MTTRQQLIEDAREAASDCDWKVAAELYREAGDEVSARSCEARIELDAAADRKAEEARKRNAEDMRYLMQAVARHLGRL